MCLRDFHTRPRLLRHLRHGAEACLQGMIQWGRFLPAEETEALRKQDHVDAVALSAIGLRPTSAETPPLEVYGPGLPPPPPNHLWVPTRIPAPAVAYNVDQIPFTPPPSEIPRVRRTVFYVLHLFGGPRRPGDVQAHFERLASVAGAPLVMLSLPVASDEVQECLSKSQTVSLFMDLIKDGHAVGVFADPPCATWTADRQGFLGGHRSPRPVRSIGNLWGLPTSSKSEWKQLELGNALYRSSLTFMYACYIFGAAGTFAHPAPPSNPLAPSSWFLPEVVHLRTLGRQDTSGNLDFAWVDQCEFAATAVKPTQFLLVGQPSFRQALSGLPRGGRCSHRDSSGRSPHEAARGSLAEDLRAAQSEQYSSEL